MAQAAIKRDARYTYADYLTWPDEERWELIRGVAYPRHATPIVAPPTRHQAVLRDLAVQFAHFLHGKKNEEVVMGPFDVRLPGQGETHETASSVVQPDLLVVRDQSRLEERGCKGPPDLVVEILEPATLVKDLRDKLGLYYEQVGVPEYWVVHPTDGTVAVFRSGTDGLYGKPTYHFAGERLKVGVLPELEIDLAMVFEECAPYEAFPA